MPKQTFFNLSEDKRKYIIEIALEEFAQLEYKSASLSRIVEKAGISKGSMYQYFENKKDLYLYLLDYTSELKLSFLNKNVNSIKLDFFKLYKELLFLSTKYNLSYPLYSRILYHGARESYHKEIGNVAALIRNRSKDFIKDLIISAIEDNQIRDNIDLDLAAFYISNTSIDLEDYISDKYGFSYDIVLAEGKGKLPISDSELEKIIDQLINLFERGLVYEKIKSI